VKLRVTFQWIHDYRGLYDFHHRLPAAERKRLMVLRSRLGPHKLDLSFNAVRSAPHCADWRLAVLPTAPNSLI
jgi:hypothetical protein